MTLTNAFVQPLSGSDRLAIATFACDNDQRGGACLSIDSVNELTP
jgi:hypothetical protein